MDPFTGFVLALIMVVVNLTIRAIAWPFRKIKEAAAAQPRRTARMVLGAVAAGLFAYLFKLPYVFEISFAGGIVGIVLGEVFS
ncbi:MAG: hypothetical protein WAZ34_10590 [Rhodocyclaceae bacterium]